ncbi:uncharacterized protein LOC144104644 [Amblyomma americanum]
MAQQNGDKAARSAPTGAETPSGSEQLCARCAATLSKGAGKSSAGKSSSIPWKTIGITAGTAVVTGTAAVVLAPLALSAAGFSAGGVVAGSMAAGIQSTMGGVIAKGSLFALCQSWGAVGLTTAAQAACAATGASVGGAAGGFAAWFKGKGQAKNPPEDPKKKPKEKPREEPDGAAEKESEEKPREKAEPDDEVEKQEEPEVVIHLCPSCGAKYRCGSKLGKSTL